jgi:hypothetical protein
LTNKKIPVTITTYFIILFLIMARKSSKNRMKASLRQLRNKSTPELEAEYEKIKDTEELLPSKIARRIELIETVLMERSDSRIEILRAVGNV